MKLLTTMLLVCAHVAFAQPERRILPRPSTITESGSYRLDRDIAESIVITASDVTLDLNGYSSAP
jgi:hypothetical protein